MPHVVKSALVPYSPEAMFRLVADVEGYPDFLPWCASATVHSRDEDHVVASIEMAKGPVHKTFTTRNRLCPDESIEMELVDGPFRHLEGHWRFVPVGNPGCQVELDLEFELTSGLLRKLLGPVFAEIADTMVDAFCRRARDLDGAL